MKKKRKRGFTLMELLIVFSVLGVLTTSGTFVAKTQIDKAQDARRKEDLTNIQLALTHYYSDFGLYPEATTLQACGGDSLAPYLKEVPCDPRSRQPYAYVLHPRGQGYEAYTNLARINDPIITQLGCQNGCGPDNAYNYGVSSSNLRIGRASSEEGVQPECGGPGNWFCFPNVCAACCPGSTYRCNGRGDRCILDPTCGS